MYSVFGITQLSSIHLQHVSAHPWIYEQLYMWQYENGANVGMEALFKEYKTWLKQ